MLSLQRPKHKQCPQRLSGREGRLGLARAIHCANSKACCGWGKAGRSYLRGGGGGFLKHTAQCHGEAVGVSYGLADWQRKGGVSFCGTLLHCSNPREVSGHKVREEETEKVANWAHQESGLA